MVCGQDLCDILELFFYLAEAIDEVKNNKSKALELFEKSYTKRSRKNKTKAEEEGKRSKLNDEKIA